MRERVHRLTAFNTATESTNKIHDDAVARRYGFAGGLVPGVEVYAYLTNPIVGEWGRDWLERGTLAARFVEPVYDGDEVLITARFDEGATGADVECAGAVGQVCATGHATLPAMAPAPPDLAGFPQVSIPMDPPPASRDSLVVGDVLGNFAAGFHADKGRQYLADVREDLSIYTDLGIAHPGWLLRFANFVLGANVMLGPWIHVGSVVQNHSVVEDGETVSARALVTGVYERKGHEFVELGVVLVADDERLVCEVDHTAIYKPRTLDQGQP